MCDVCWVTTIKKICDCDVFFNFDSLHKEHICDAVFYEDDKIKIKKYITTNMRQTKNDIDIQ